MSISISAAGGYDTLYPVYNTTPVSPVNQSPAVGRGSEIPQEALEGQKVGKGECQTCKNRKYVDGSNENNVSFKAPGHIDPGSSAATVMAHEREHVSNAVAEGSQKNKQLVSVSVSLQTSICPECGRVYVSGGETQTAIKTKPESSNPYDKLQRDMMRNMMAGINFDKIA